MELFSIKNWSDELGEIGLFTKSVRYGGGIYGYEVKALNQQVKRNIDRFPEDFMFQLKKEEVPKEFSKSQIVTLNEKGDKRGTNIKKCHMLFLSKEYTCSQLF